MNNKDITKNVVFLTFMNILMQTLALIVNVCITRSLGAATVGSVSLIGTFYSLLCIIAGGNVFVCTSRLGAEEEGKCGNTEAILKYAIFFSMSVTLITCILVLALSDFVLSKISVCPKRAIILLMCGLPLASIGAALKGYFNSKRLQFIPACADIAEFLIKSAVLMFYVQFFVQNNKSDIYTAIGVSIICGEAVSLVLMLILKKLKCKKSKRAPSMRFSRFILMSLPIMMNSYVCAFLSSANDFLMPLTLRQSGDAMNDALAKFGIFEAIVLPILFFPSCVISSLCSVVLPEISRANGENSQIGIKNLAQRALKTTLTFSIFVSSVFFFKGELIADVISGEALAGKTLVLLSPIIPFIYLEIILEAIIKGMGRHGFSSLNYLAEYMVRISLLLVCVPLFGFSGVIISYAASNICSNVARLVLISKVSSVNIKPIEYVVMPMFLSLFSVFLSNIVCKVSLFANDLLNIIISCLFSLIIYMLTLSFISSVAKHKKQLVT